METGISFHAGECSSTREANNLSGGRSPGFEESATLEECLGCFLGLAATTDFNFLCSPLGGASVVTTEAGLFIGDLADAVAKLARVNCAADGFIRTGAKEVAVEQARAVYHANEVDIVPIWQTSEGRLTWKWSPTPCQAEEPKTIRKILI